MIEVRYSAPYSLDISGSVEELQNVRRAVLEVAQSDAVIELEANAAIDPKPYQKALSKVIVTTNAHPVKVSVANDVVRIEGSSDCLDALASFFDFKVDTVKGDHAHYEYYEGNQCITSDSLPLVIGVS